MIRRNMPKIVESRKNIALWFLFMAIISLLALSRFGAYIPSPLPYLYLNEFFVLIFLGLSVGIGSKTTLYERLYISVCIAYMLLKILYDIRNSFEIEIAIRNIAPMLYICMAIPLANRFRIYKSHTINMAFKIGSLLFVAQYILMFYILDPSIVVEIANKWKIFDVSSYPDFPSDFAGVVCAIGFVFWKSRNIGIIRNIAAYSFAAIVSSPSRTAVIAFIIVAVVWIFKINSGSRKLIARDICILIMSAVLSISFKYFASNSQNTLRLNTVLTGEASPEVFLRILRESSFMRTYSESEYLIKKKSINIKPIDTNETSLDKNLSTTLPATGFAYVYECFISGSCGTFSARIATWIITAKFLYANNYILFGAPVGKNNLLDSCIQYGKKWNDGDRYYFGGEKYDKCPVESSFSNRRLLDPHNGLIYIFLNLGLIGLIFFAAPIALLIYSFYKSEKNQECCRYFMLVCCLLFEQLSTTLFSSSYGLLALSFGFAGTVAYMNNIDK